MSNFNIPVEFNSDENGFFDRQCPNEKCEYVFKIYMEDWKNKVSDEHVYCPMCGHDSPSDKWYTNEQLAAIKEIVTSFAISYASEELNKTLKCIEQNTRESKYIQFTYEPSKRASFINNPIGQRPEWELEITCEKCQTRYSVIGSAYFCPCCGYNAVERVFSESLDTVEKMIKSLEDVYATFEKSYGKDKATSMRKSMLEGTLGDIISAFQKFAEHIYCHIMPENKIRVNDFQIIEKGSRLFFEAIGKSYNEWLTDIEINDLNILFQQRHLIEHNNGLIDEKYITNSNDQSYKIGQRVIIKSSDSLRLLRHVKKLSDGLRKQFEMYLLQE